MRKIQLLLLFILLYNIGHSQVGINTNNPNPLTDLDIKNEVRNGNDTIPRGVMIPRLTQEQRDIIDVSSAQLANGLLIYNTDEGCFNYFDQFSDSWQSLCGKSENAEIEIANCADVSAKGDYQGGVDLIQDNYISMKVKVLRTGSYSITAGANPSTGYFFNLSGEFISPGEFTLRIPGFGMPQNYSSTTVTDKVLIKINKQTQTCFVNIPVKPAMSLPSYNVDCNTVKVFGSYTIGSKLNNTHYIKIQITPDPVDVGKNYLITTNTLNGYRFTGSGTLKSGSQEVILYGEGKPILSQADKFTLSFNSSMANITCEAIVQVIPRKIKIAGLGAAIYNISSSASGMNRVLKNSGLFGKDATSFYRVGDLELVEGLDLTADIIVVGYPYILPKSSINSVVNYLDNGGILIYQSDVISNALDLVKAVFDDNSITYKTTTEDEHYLPTTNTPILNGPYMDLKGRYLSRDAGANFNVSLTPAVFSKGTVIAQGENNSAHILLHNSRNFLLIGDGGLFAWAKNNKSPYAYAMKLDDNYLPMVNTYSNIPAYNAHFFVNVMAWALDLVKQKQAIQ